MEFTNQSLIFHAGELSKNQLVVTKLHGQERISDTFRFELELLGTKADAANLKLEDILYQPAKVGIRQPRDFGGTVRNVTLWYAGILSELDQLEEGSGWVRYRAVLVPRLWLLNEFYRSRIFQSVTVDQMVHEVLTGELGMVGEPFAPIENRPTKKRERREADFHFNLGRIDQDVPPEQRDACPQREYVVQYQESDFDFISRWLEHEGIFYFFQNDTNDHEHIVFADHVGTYKPISGKASLPYRPQSATGGASTEQGQEEISALRTHLRRHPGQVQLNDYNWRSPRASLLVDHQLPKGVGVQNEYNDHYKNVGQGKALAQVRAEELLCREKVVSGTSTCRSFRPGRTFELTDHFVTDTNGAYLLTAVEHRAEQSINLDASTVTGAKYENTFEAIPADVVFRPACETEWPTIKGVMHARVDGESDDSDYAQLDALGRYKLTIPFDDKLGDASPGKASRWVRMAQPYAGADGGMHFPLMKGTEVIVTHIDGDPDRPIIASAVPNVETHSPVHRGNASQNRIQTTSGNLFLMDDDDQGTGFVLIDGGGRRVEDSRMPRREGAGSVGAGPGYGGAAPSRPPGSSSAGAARDPLPTGPPPPPPPLRRLGLRPAGGPLPESVLRRWREQLGAGRGMAETYDQLSFAGTTDSVKLDNATAGADGTEVTGFVDADGDGIADDGELTYAASGAYTKKTGTLEVDTDGDDITDSTVDVYTGISPLEYFANACGQGATATIVKALDWLGSYGTKADYSDGFQTLQDGESYILAANEWDPAIRMVFNVGDQITVKEGGSKSAHWTFDNIGNSISFGTGGYSFSQNGTPTDKTAHNKSVSYQYGDDKSYSETHGHVSSTSKFYGGTSGQSWYFGTITGTEFKFDAAATFSLQVGAETNTSIKIGAYNTNSIFIGGEVDISLYMGVPVPGLGVMGGKAALDIFVGGKANLDIAAAVAWKCELSAVGTYTVNVKSLDTELNASQRKKFSLDDAEVILKHDHAELAKTKAALNETQAALKKDQAVLKKTLAALKEDGIFLSETETALDKADTALNETNTALNESSTALSSKDTALSKDITSALTKIQ